MKIIIDADASPVIAISEQVAKLFNIDIVLVCDYNHNIESTNKVIYVDKGHDSADFKIISLVNANDIVITQDYALASLCLDKGALVIHNNGFIIDHSNIDTLLQARYLNQKARKAKTKIPNMKKRSKEDDLKFQSTLTDILNKTKPE